ncbi:uncharacterized protein LOC125369546 [Ricinus communis]|uniref:uncharacterized protein LOC125369546 n=1 Tax=Ricinus communis TaxID=3988 RepID=UPI00201B1B9E|nr:uncharacterized protein LOC125369546 [Ricinus communis]
MKSAHFLPVQQSDSLGKLAGINCKLHGVPTSIVSYRDPRFTSHFFGKFAKSFRDKITFQYSISPPDRWTIGEDNSNIRRCVKSFYHSSIGMAAYEALYGRRCRSPVCWDMDELRQLEDPELIQETGIIRFGRQGKLSPRYIGPFEILEKVGPLAYRLALPQELSQIHDVFHVSMLRRHRSDPSHIVQESKIQLTEDLNNKEEPARILDRQIKKLRNKEIPIVKVKWSQHSPKEATWEVEKDMRVQYPYLFSENGE